MATGKTRAETTRIRRFGPATILIFAVLVMAGAALTLGFLKRQTPDLDLSIQMDATEFGPDEPIVVHGRLVNNDVEPVRIFPPAVADFTFEVIVLDDDDHRYEKHVPYQRGIKPQQQARELRPGEHVTVDEDLRHGYGIVAGREYRVRAAYRTLNYPDEDVWYGIIKSNQLDIVIRAK